jgi:hypothetical protein
MPEADFAVYRSSFRTGVAAFQPWADKMRPADRLLIHDDHGAPPLAGLEWHAAGPAVWIGRTRRMTR